MGLDVYLHKCPNFEEARAIQREVRTRTDPLWEALPQGHTDAEYKEVRQKVAAIYDEYGLSEYGEFPDRQNVELPSDKYPDHLFKLGYFRSSYNGAGINSVAKRLGLPSLYDIFNPPNDYEFKPDWYDAEDRAVAALDDWKEAQANEKYDVIDVSPNMFDPDYGARNSTQALKFFQRNADRDPKPLFREFSCMDGQFFLDGLKVFGAIPGKTATFNQPCVYLIIESAGLDSYVQAMEIVLETIRFVLAQPDADDYYLTWSG